MTCNGPKCLVESATQPFPDYGPQHFSTGNLSVTHLGLAILRAAVSLLALGPPHANVPTHPAFLLVLKVGGVGEHLDEVAHWAFSCEVEVSFEILVAGLFGLAHTDNLTFPLALAHVDHSNA